MANWYRKMFSASLIIKEMQIKPPDTTLHLLAWLLSKRQEITSIGKDEEKRQHLCTVGGDIN